MSLLLAGLAIQACSDSGKSSEDGDGTGGLGGAGHSPGGMAGESSGSGGKGSGTGGHGTGGHAAGGAGQATGGATSPGGAAGAAGSAGEGGAGPGKCEIGEAQNPAAPGSLDLFGQISFYANGAELPAGRYRVSFVDGCFKYSGAQDWTIHAYANDPSYGWYLGGEKNDRLVQLPGTVGWAASNGAFTDFEDCVEANQALAPVEFDFAGGVLGIWLADSNYPDNVAGVDGRNPTWKLTRVDGGCE